MNKKETFRLLNQLHLYSGLFCAVYLMITGLSTLNMQHHFLPDRPSDTISYTRKIAFDPDLKPDSLACYIKEQLEIKGHTPPWDFRQDTSGKFSFIIHRPARQFDVELNRNSELIRIDEIHFSAGRILNLLHKSIFIELDDFPLKAWAYFGQFSALCAVFTVCTSIFFWFRRSLGTGKRIVIVSTAFVSIFYILFIWLIG